MNPLKKLKMQIQHKSRVERERRLRDRFGESGLAKQCMHCRWFVYREERPRNWVCRVPDEKNRGFKGTVCFSFVPGEHPEMVFFNSGGAR